MKNTENQPGQNDGEESMAKPNQQQFDERLEQVTAEVSRESGERRTAVEGGLSEAKEAVRESADKARGLAREGAEKVGDLAREGAEKVGDLAREGAEKVGDAARDVQETSREVAQTMRGVVKQHPIPAVLTGLGAACTGIGMTWLLMGQRRRAATNGSNGRTSAEETLSSTDLSGPVEQPEKIEAIETRAEGAIAHATHETQHLAQRAQESIEGAAHGAAARVRRFARDARAEGQLLGETAEKQFREHPLAVGAGLVAIGTTIGISLPSTLRENRWLGKRRDAFMDRARSTARGAARKLEALGKPAQASSQ